ncbi:MAG: gliding motility lipoprotein GldD [Bacteroidia bacterium]|nr:gliding motility lipoprotein GldD [Bacteroidia bacterium]
MKYTPRQRGYFRIDLPEKKYRTYTEDCPFRFDYPVYAVIRPDENRNAEPCWINVCFDNFKAIIHLSFKKVNGNLESMTEDAHSFVYRHTIKADAIDERRISLPEKKVYGILYDIKGNAASSMQFYLTDSADHFIRGALYFSVKPNKDSLAPVIGFVRKDIENMINTFEWK